MEPDVNRRPIWIRAVAITLLLVAAATVVVALSLRNMFAQRGMKDARSGIAQLAELLHKYQQEHADLPSHLTPEQLAGSEGRYRFSGGHFDRFEYSIHVVGEWHSYEGTTITYAGAGSQAQIVLTVQDLSKQQWTIREDETPGWWEVWK
jgi:hypothetical protein